MENNLYLPMLNLTPTMRCNLKCKLCGVLVPQYAYRPHMTVKEFADTLCATFSFIDRVGKLQITGGEPLLHKDLPSMLEECFFYTDKFDALWLFTNCSVPVKAELLDVICKYKNKIVVHCSDYGVDSKIAEQVVTALRENDIPYKYLKYYGDEQYLEGWVDQGDFVKHNRTQAELEKVFSACSHVQRGGSWYVRNGQMHWCGRSIRGCEVEKIPLDIKDYLNIYQGSVDERREKLRQLQSAQYITACDYCNGLYGTNDTDQRKPAGEQLV